MPDGHWRDMAREKLAEKHAQHAPHAAAAAPEKGEVPPPRVVDPQWGELTLEGAREKMMEIAPRNPLWRSPLFRRLYLLLFVLWSIVVLVPVWSVYFLPRRNRPFRSWPLQRCLRVRWSRHISTVVAVCEIDYLGRNLDVPLNPYKLKSSHPIVIAPAPAGWLRGHPREMLAMIHANRGSWAPRFIFRHWPARAGAWGKWNPKPSLTVPDDEGFMPVQGFWYTGEKASPYAQPRRRHPGQPVLLFLHGGGYILGSAAEHDLTSSVAKSFVVHTPIRHVLSVEYRLASSAPWPMPLLDAISAYHHLLAEGVAERDIVIAGDSAGGHLSLALARWVRDEGPALGLTGPRGLVLLSPWSDLGFTHFWGLRNAHHNEDLDTIDGSFGPFAASLLLRGLDARTPWESPYLAPAGLMLPPRPENGFAGFPPTFIVYGRAERLEMEICELYARIKAARGHRRAGGGGYKRGKRRTTRDRLLATKEAVHDFMIFPWFAPEASVAYEEIDDWLRHLFSVETPGIHTTPPTPESETQAPREKAERERRERERDSSVEKTEALVNGDATPRAPASILRQRPRAKSASISLPASAATPRPRIRMLPKSPRMLPVHDTPRQFMHDLRTQSLDLIDLHPTELFDDVLSPLRLDERELGPASWHDVADSEPASGGEPYDDDEDDDDEEEDDGCLESEDGSEERWLFE